MNINDKKIKFLIEKMESQLRTAKYNREITNIFLGYSIDDIINFIKIFPLHFGKENSYAINIYYDNIKRKILYKSSETSYVHNCLTNFTPDEIKSLLDKYKKMKAFT